MEMAADLTEPKDPTLELNLSDMSDGLAVANVSLGITEKLGVKIGDTKKHASQIEAAKGAIETGTTILAGGAAVVTATGLTVAATSGAGIASGLAAAGSIIGGGMAAGPAALAAGPTYLAAQALNKTVFAKDSRDDSEEALAKSIARIGTKAGGVVGVIGTGATVVAGGASGAAIMSTLATVGSIVGGGALAGVGVLAVAPIAVAGSIGYGAYRMFGGGKKKRKQS
ncbi:hypothetical protein [Hyphomonas chukchiensis]|nr:hypothetical protein [Hyphomonas chukchiensis]